MTIQVFDLICDDDAGPMKQHKWQEQSPEYFPILGLKKNKQMTVLQRQQ